MSENIEKLRTLLEKTADLTRKVNGGTEGLTVDDMNQEITGNETVTAFASANKTIDTNDMWQYARTIALPEGISFIPSKFCSPGFGDNNILRKVTFPSTVYGIGFSAFYYCRKLEEINVPPNLSYIHSNAFNGCEKLKYANLAFPSSLQTIGEYAFFRCYGLTGSLTIPSSLTSMGSRAFDYTPIDSLIYHASVMNQAAFADCSKLVSATFTSDELLTLPNNCFKDCVSLATVNLPPNLIDIGGGAFNDTGLTSITLPSGITSIKTGTFSSCIYLSGVTFLGDIATIGDYAFANCRSLSSFSIPQTVTRIGELAFAGAMITSVNIPSATTEIGDGAFRCTTLQSIAVDPGNHAYDSRDNCNCLIKTVGNKLLQGSSDSVIPSTVTSIEDNAFFGIGIDSLEIPSSITKIGEAAFDSCSISSVWLPNSIVSLGERAFNNCESLTSIHFPPAGSLVEIPDNLCAGCRSLTGVSIPDGYTLIGSGAFANSGLVQVALPQDLETIEYNAFSYTNLESIEIPASVTKIEPDAFSYNDQLDGHILVHYPNPINQLSGDDTYLKNVLRSFYAERLIHIEILDGDGVTTQVNLEDYFSGGSGSGD